MMKNWTFSELDETIAGELGDFLPAKIFDIHAHLYRVDDLALSGPSMLTEGPAEVTRDVWHEYMGKMLGRERLAGGLFFPLRTKPPIDDSNDFIVSQLDGQPASRGLIMIYPGYSQEKVAEYLRNDQIVGFKCYHLFSDQKPTWNAPIESYLPEWAWQLADEKGLVITLHMVRDGAIADLENQREIWGMCTRYPGAKLILAHAARGFHAPNTVKGVASLRGLQNVWFDMSGVTEAAPLAAILNEFGPRTLMWGSDFPVSETRGRAVTIGDGFFWLDPSTVDWEKAAHCRPTLVGLESLRALRDAANDFGLNAGDLENIFYHNAQRLLGMEQESGTVTQDMYTYAKGRIPGGTQLLSKRPEMKAPNQWPAYACESRGCEVWDLDGRHYFDFTSVGIGACLLGNRDPDVTRAVLRRINLGSMSELSYAEEVELADLLCEIHPWAEQARFTRAGGETAVVAIRIARATTDRSVVAYCGYHGWHDWYLAANLGEDDALRGHLLPGLDPLGVPRELRGTAMPFTYNNREEFQAILDTYGDRLAAVIMEPCRYHDPEPGFLEFVRDGTHRLGALLVFDEITIGWRLHFGGSHLRFGVNPDIAIFAKSLGNGHPIGAVIGTSEAMEGAHTSFISSTYWTEGVGPAAAVATLRKMGRIDLPAHVAHIGQMVKDQWLHYGAKYELPVESDDGYPCLAHFHFAHERAEEMRTLYTQLMLEQGFLAGPSIYPTLAHTDELVGLHGEAVDRVFSQMADLLQAGKIRESLKGPVAHSGFRRLL